MRTYPWGQTQSLQSSTWCMSSHSFSATVFPAVVTRELSTGEESRNVCCSVCFLVVVIRVVFVCWVLLYYYVLSFFGGGAKAHSGGWRGNVGILGKGQIWVGAIYIPTATWSQPITGSDLPAKDCRFNECRKSTVNERLIICWWAEDRGKERILTRREKVCWWLKIRRLRKSVPNLKFKCCRKNHTNSHDSTWDFIDPSQSAQQACDSQNNDRFVHLITKMFVYLTKCISKVNKLRATHTGTGTDHKQLDPLVNKAADSSQSI